VGILQTIAIWEPVRWIILKMQSRFPGLRNARRRILICGSILFAYAFVVGFGRVFLEDRTNIWHSPALHPITVAWATGVCLLFIMLELAVYESIYFFFEWNRAREEAEQLKQLNYQIQFDSLKVQIQPHFLFNTLNTLIGLVEEDKPETVVRYTEEIAAVYRYLLVANDHQLIALKEEIKFIEAYLYLIQTRYSQGLHVEMDLRGDLDKYLISPLSLQILLENAVKHNIITRARPLNIRIELDHINRQITVRNNLQHRTEGVQSTGKGLDHLRRKLELLGLPPMTIRRTEQDFTVSIPLEIDP
jgi:LytS/YehU family sensor histidine kinase